MIIFLIKSIMFSIFYLKPLEIFDLRLIDRNFEKLRKKFIKINVEFILKNLIYLKKTF